MVTNRKSRSQKETEVFIYWFLGIDFFFMHLHLWFLMKLGDARKEYACHSFLIPFLKTYHSLLQTYVPFVKLYVSHLELRIKCTDYLSLIATSSKAVLGHKHRNREWGGGGWRISKGLMLKCNMNKKAMKRKNTMINETKLF